VVRTQGGPRVRRQKGAIEKLYTAPPRGAAVVCLDEMGPESAKSFPGQEVIDPLPKADRPAGRVKQAAEFFHAQIPSTYLNQRADYPPDHLP